MKKTLQIGIAAALATTTFFGATNSKNDENVQARSIYSSCTAFNGKYPHGVKVSAKTKNTVHKRNGSVVYEYSRAYVSASIYKKATHKNPDLDRDRDGIACER